MSGAEWVMMGIVGLAGFGLLLLAMFGGGDWAEGGDWEELSTNARMKRALEVEEKKGDEESLK